MATEEAKFRAAVNIIRSMPKNGTIRLRFVIQLLPSSSSSLLLLLLCASVVQQEYARGAYFFSRLSQVNVFF